MLSKETLLFLEDLKANNNRDWFLGNKKRYESYKQECHQLIRDLLEIMKPQDASLAMLEVKNCTFRINRDIRFSKDKSPYKTYMGIWLRSGSLHSEAPGYYINIEKDASFVGGGLYCPMPEQIQKIRKEINFFYEDLQSILNNDSFKSTYGNLNREDNSTLKNPPKGYEKDNPAIEYLKLKSYTATQKINNADLTKNDFAQVISQKLLALKPLNEFINRALNAED
jgi:uncharacterized protein (TIGR02453 family)